MGDNIVKDTNGFEQYKRLIEYRLEKTEERDQSINNKLDLIIEKLAQANLNELKKDVESLKTFKTRAIAIFTTVQIIFGTLIGYFIKFFKP